MTKEKVVGKGEIARDKHFFPFPTILSTLSKDYFSISNVCKHFQFGTVKNLGFGKLLNYANTF